MSLPKILKQVEASIGDADACERLAADLTTFGKALATDSVQRRETVNDSDLERTLVTAWKLVSETFGSSSQPSGEEVVVDATSSALLSLAVALGRLTRNLLIGSAEAKELVLACEPSIRSLAYRITTFDKIKGPRYLALQRAVYQTLANLFAPVDSDSDASKGLQDLSRLYFGGKQREDDIVSRALDSDDVSVNHAVLLLIRGATRLSPTTVIDSLATSTAAGKISSRLLDKMATRWFESDARCFDAGALVFDAIIVAGKTHQLYDTLRSSEQEPISPSQATLLKLLDAHLHASGNAAAAPPKLTFIIPTLHDLADYARRAMNVSEAEGGRREAASKDDPLLPRVFEGLILTSQCLHALALAGQADKTKGDSADTADNNDDDGDANESLLLQRLKDGSTLETLVGLLQDLEVFIPRVKPFRPPAPGQRDDANVTPTAAAAASPAPDAAAAAAAAGDRFRPFATLKRDIVQLIGIMAFEDRAVQDRVRLCGGVETILSMCVADDANPYIREHALFATRHLLLGNPDNQAIIGKMDPLGIVDEQTGELRELPQRMGVNGSKNKS